MEIKDMTEAELVEAVAREVLDKEAYTAQGGRVFWAYTDNDGNKLARIFDPFHDMNDLFTVLEKHDKWEIVRTAVYTVNIWIAPGEIKQASSIFLPRAVLEAALAAERSEK